MKALMLTKIAFLMSMVALSATCREYPQTICEATELIVHIAVGGTGTKTGKSEISSASGVIAGPDGHILTCGHLFWVGDDNEDLLKIRLLTIVFPSGHTIKLSDLGQCQPNPALDVTYDLALISLGRPLKGLPLREAAAGEPVWVLGYQGLGAEVTTIQGIVKLALADGRLLLELLEPLVPGMSGSAVVGEDGALLGIVVAKALGCYALAAPSHLMAALQIMVECGQY